MKYVFLILISMIHLNSQARSAFQGLEYAQGVKKYSLAVCTAQKKAKACKNINCKKTLAALTMIVFKDFQNTYGKIPPESAEACK